MADEAVRHRPRIGLPKPMLFIQSDSVDTSVGTDLETNESCVRPLTSTSLSTAYINPPSVYSSKLHLKSKQNMTTYYLYKEGKVVGTSHSGPMPQPTGEPQSPGAYERRGDVVGAYLARRAMNHRSYGDQSVVLSQNSHSKADELHGEAGSRESLDQNHWSDENKHSPNHAYGVFSGRLNTVGNMGVASQYQKMPWPDLDTVRPSHTMCNLLSYIQPERKLISLSGMCVDIVEQDTGTLFAYAIPKKLLVLFLGRHVVNKFIQTTERYENMNWPGRETQQILHLPRGRSSRAAMRILVAWMTRACRQSTMETMQPIRIPKNLFAACSLAQTMELFALYRDAYRVDLSLSKTLFMRPIFPVELETLWNCLGEHSRYVYCAIKAVGNHIRALDGAGAAKELGWMEQMTFFLEMHEQIKARVYDTRLNEEYRPVFGTQWMYTERG